MVPESVWSERKAVEINGKVRVVESSEIEVDGGEVDLKVLL